MIETNKHGAAAEYEGLAALVHRKIVTQDVISATLSGRMDNASSATETSKSKKVRRSRRNVCMCIRERQAMATTGVDK